MHLPRVSDHPKFSNLQPSAHYQKLASNPAGKGGDDLIRTEAGSSRKGHGRLNNSTPALCGMRPKPRPNSTLVYGRVPVHQETVHWAVSVDAHRAPVWALWSHAGEAT
jgi:hypothetical protein